MFETHQPAIEPIKNHVSRILCPSPLHEKQCWSMMNPAMAATQTGGPGPVGPRLVPQNMGSPQLQNTSHGLRVPNISGFCPLPCVSRNRTFILSPDFRFPKISSCCCVLKPFAERHKSFFHCQSPKAKLQDEVCTCSPQPGPWQLEKSIENLWCMLTQTNIFWGNLPTTVGKIGLVQKQGKTNKKLMVHHQVWGYNIFRRFYIPERSLFG